MSTSQSSQSRATNSIDLASTLPTSATSMTTRSKSSAYNANFDCHLTDHGIRPIYSSRRPDLTKARSALAVSRSSLSLSRFSEGAFEAFQDANARAKNEAEVMAYAMPTILGPYQPAHPSAIKTVFNKLEPLTDGTIVQPEPDIYYGADPGELVRPVRDALRHHIMPSTREDRPWVPNFSVEVKGPKGTPDVATQQVRYYGALGSRAMHSLQNYGEEKPKHDGEVYTYSSTYHGGTGTLQLYAHYATAPAEEGGRPEYHMIQLRSFGMTDTRETFLQGATALRNARDLAKTHRDRFIQAANARASQPRSPVSEDIVQTPNEGAPAADLSKWRDGDEESQQSTIDASGHELTDDGEATTTPPHLPMEDTSESSQDSAALGNGTSVRLTSSFTSSLGSAKRPRQSISPSPSNVREGRSLKGRKRTSKKRKAELPPTIATRLDSKEARGDTSSNISSRRKGR
ncbi:hypothetical protein SEPCBS57363_006557 [Sporothrix epigloea]|uniref:DUF7924 domain-containing protein n=1 Tax=Sporothrix epigloea TaxID=1892477 RepID=A0ABP0E3P7_9PEZI